MKPAIVLLLMLTTGLSAIHAEEISLTVYNRDLAVVKIADEMSFEKGRQTVTFTGVADKIDPTSVRFSAKEDGVNIIEQNYRYDLVNSKKILQRYIDNTIAVRLKDGELIEGALQSASGDVVIQGGDGKLNIVKGDAVERYEFPELPEGLVTRPTLFWEMYSKRAVGKTPTEVSYMTRGFSWHAEYTAVVDDDDSGLELSSWVSINNTSGATFNGASLKLVAGDIHRISEPRPRMKREMLAMQADEAAPGGFEERGLFEYHLYELQGKTTVNNAEIKQIALFDPAGVKANKLFVYNARKNTTKVSVNVEFTNSDKDGLGIPLPAGKVRVYKKDVDGGLEFVGEDTIDHTPKNEKAKLMLGYAFDIRGERKVTDSKRISQRIREETIEISLRNRKDEPVVVAVVENLWGDWEIRDSSMEYKKKDAYTVWFTVTVPADSEAAITYTFRTQ